MGALTKIQLLLKHMQFIGLLRSIDIEFPKVYVNFASLSNLVSLDPQFLQSIDASFPVFSFRLQFFFIAVALPLLIMILTLLVFVNFTTIMWMAFCVCSLLVLAIRIAASANQGFVNGGNINSQELLIVMIASLAYCATYRLVAKLLNRDRLIVIFVKNLLSATMLVAGGCMINPTNQSLRIIITVALFNLSNYVYKGNVSRGFKFLGFVALGGAAAATWVKMQTTYEGVFPEIMIIPGYLLIALSAAGWLQFLMYSNSNRGFGRAFVTARQKIQHVLDKSLLAVAFFFLSSAFVPVVTACLQMFVCDSYNCAAGYKFNPFLPVDYSKPLNETVRNMYCDPCDFIGGCGFDKNTLCPMFNETRLFFHPETPCNDSLALYYQVSAIVVMVVFVLVVSSLYVVIIREITLKLEGFTNDTYRSLMEHYRTEFTQFSVKKDRVAQRVQLQRMRSMKIRDNLERSIAGPSTEMVVMGSGPGGAILTIPTQATAYAPPQYVNPQQQPVPLAEVEDPFDAVNNSDDPFDVPMRPVAPPPPRNPASPGSNHGPAPPPRMRVVELDPLAVSLLGASTTAPPRPSPRDRRTSVLKSFFSSSDEDKQIKAMFEDIDREEREDEQAAAPEIPTYDDAIKHVNAQVEPKASSLYNAFRREYQYFLMVENTQRLALVVVSVFVSSRYPMSAMINLVIHGVCLILVLVFRPYVGKFEQFLACVVGSCDVLSAAYATLLWKLPDNSFVKSDGLGIGVLAVGVIPVVAGVVWQILDMRKDLINPYAKKIKAEREEKEKKKKTGIELIEETIRLTPSTDTERIRKLKEDLEAVKNPPPEPHEKLTDELNQSSKRLILRFFIVGILVLLFALGLCVYATLNDPGSAFLNGSDTLVRSQDVVLAGRSSWDAFTSDCCCFRSLVPMEKYNITERWACRSTSSFGGSSNSSLTYRGGQTVSRNRQATKTYDGLPIRDVCSRSFALPHCSVVVSDFIVSLSCPAEEIAANNITKLATEVLW